MGIFEQMSQRRRSGRKLAVLAVAAIAATIVLARWTGVFAFERHQGYFAPVWDPDGRLVYLLERDTAGLVWGLGWEFFSPPASSYVLRDTFIVHRVDSETGTSEELQRFEGSPISGRVTRHYRGRIFNGISARIETRDDGLEFAVEMKVPRVPTSENWTLKGAWTEAAPSNAQWTTQYAGGMAAPDEVLVNGVEVMTVRGRESFPAAVIAVAADGSYRVLVRNDDFDDLYRDGVPPEQIAERANRARIERSRVFRSVQGELTARFKAAGLNDGAATLRAYDEMEELGYLPKGPRLVATPVEVPPPGVRVFDIPAEYFRVGLFQDIAAAIAAPDQEVKTSTGTYLKYYEDELGPNLKAWRDAGNDRFAVRTGGTLYVLEVRRVRRSRPPGAEIR